MTALRILADESIAVAFIQLRNLGEVLYDTC